MYQRDIVLPVFVFVQNTSPPPAPPLQGRGGQSHLARRPSSHLTSVEKKASTPKKNTASRLVMIITMTAVTQVSFSVGQWTRLIASRRTCRTNSPGETLAMFLLA